MAGRDPTNSEGAATMNALSNSQLSAALRVAAVVLLFCWGTAGAQTGLGGVSGLPAYCHFTVSGEIGDTTVTYVRNQLNSAPKAAQSCIVSFDSLGGDVEAAIELGRFLRARNATTLVPANATCASACVLAFLGGAQRQALGRIGIHRPYSSDLSSSVGQSEHSYTHVNDLVKSYFLDINVPAELLTAMNGIPPDEVMWLSASEAARFHITGDDPAWADYQDSRTAKALGISKEALYERRNLAKRLCAGQQDPVQHYMCTSKVIHDGAQ